MFCHALLASYGVSCFPIYHSLWLASFGDWVLLDHRPSFPQPILCSFHGLVSIFLPYHSAIPTVILLDLILLGLFGPAVYFPPSDSVYSLGLFLHCLRAPVSHFPLGHLWPIWFPWASSALFQFCFPMGLNYLSWTSPAQLLYTSSLGLMGPLTLNPSAPYFLCSYYFESTMAHSRFSTYYPWVCFLSFSGSIQTRLLLQDSLYEPVSHSFPPLGLNGFFLLANFGLPMLLGFFSY